jgi:fructose-1,6-bisphosphatase/inositol monophosphatase family enzyme
MLEKLKSHLDDLITLLFEMGYYQLKNQGYVQTQSKSSNKDVEEAWLGNEVFSKVDLESEQRLIEFFNSQFHSDNFSFITEEYHSKTSPNSKYYVVIDPLDGTKPYLKGEKTFGISLGICTQKDFLFGCNYYPAFNQLIYAFYDIEGVYNQYHNQIDFPQGWESDCSVTSQFSYLLKDYSAMTHFLESELGLTFVVVPDCAIYRFKLMLEGFLAAYFSEGLFIWDIGPSTLLMEKIGVGMVNPLNHSAVKVGDLLTPPFRQSVFLAAPKNGLGTICSKFRQFVR